MEHVGIRRGVLVCIAALVLLSSQVGAQAPYLDRSEEQQIVHGEDLLLPDGRPLPDLPITVSGKVENKELRVVTWSADLAVAGDDFEGKISFPDMPVLMPLTVQGTRDGDIVEFFVTLGKTEVAYFAGHLAGTSLVGTFDSLNGEKGNWSGLWLPETYKVREEVVRYEPRSRRSGVLGR